MELGMPYDGYHKLPDRSPYYYYRSPKGGRLHFSMDEVNRVIPHGGVWVLETVEGARYLVTTNKPEKIEATSAPDIHEAFKARWSRAKP